MIPVSGREMVELILGRLAMAGLDGCGLVALCTGRSVLDQAAAFPDNVALVAAAVTAASVTVRSLDSGLEVRFRPAFSLRAEKVHGRLSMLGFGAVVGWELLWRALGAWR